jgi:subtilisin family serine protease
VNSLGNEGSSSWYYLSAPSDGDSVMGIGAVDWNGSYASFSSHGPSSDGRVKPDVAAQGSGCYIVDPYSGQFTYGSGTSFSSPILAGMSACLWQANPSQTNMQIADAIRQSGSQYLNPDDFLGYGIPNFVSANNILTIIDGPDAKDLDVAVFPNPFTDELRIGLVNLTGLVTGKVIISEITGRRILTKDMASDNASSEITISDLAGLNPGIYIITVQTETGIANAMAIKH